jgi:CrcB protein
MSALTWIGVALIGGVAALARVTVDGLTARGVGRVLRGPGPRLAAGTFVVNLTGAFLLGLVDGLALSGTASILIATAGIGTYTTFSTWMLHTEVLRADGARRAAVVNALGSLLVGFGAVAAGHALGTLL